MLFFSGNKNRFRPAERKNKNQRDEINKIMAIVVQQDQKQHQALFSDNNLWGFYETCGGGYSDPNSEMTRSDEDQEFTEEAVEFCLEKLIESVDLNLEVQGIIFVN